MRVILLVMLAAQVMAQIPGNPRFHRGDDRRWADPAFDDRGWDRVADRFGYTMEELAVNRQWVRRDVDVPAGRSQLIVVLCACEFFLDGVRVGATGDLDAALPEANYSLMALPVPATIPAGPAVLAIRQYSPPGMEVALPITFTRADRVQLVPESHVASTLLAVRRARELQIFPAIVLFIALTMVLTTVGIRRIEGVSALLSVYVLGQGFIVLLVSGTTVDRTTWVLNWAAAIPTLPATLGAMALACRLPLPRLPILAYLILHFGLRGLWVADLLRADPAPWTPAISAAYLALIGVAIALGILIAVKSWEASGAPRVLLLAGLVVLCMNLLGRFAIVGGGIAFLGAAYNWDRIANLAFAVAAASWVIRRERSRRAEELRLKGEMEAARSVQSLLLGQKQPEGVEAVYLPASEVGGDFYQTIATPAGTLILVGDVSGKGSSAAMTAAALTGAVRLLRHHGPAEILTKLNSVLDAHSGFVTCCCVLVESDGVRAASAGHPAPYADGEELALPAGLPLGMVEDVRYEEARFPLPRVLTLISDGVVEAGNSKGELFGFERARDMSTRPAREIAEAARNWGQNDDITVVTVQSTAVRVSAA